MVSEIAIKWIKFRHVRSCMVSEIVERLGSLREGLGGYIEGEGNGL